MKTHEESTRLYCITSGPNEVRCCGPHCMGWRWEYSDDDWALMCDGVKTRKGYCGLAGRPTGK